jgi:hypothetical protein
VSAIIAAARKVIILDYKSVSRLVLPEIGSGILDLGLTYLLPKTNCFPFTKPPMKTRKQQELRAEGESKIFCLGCLGRILLSRCSGAQFLTGLTEAS